MKKALLAVLISTASVAALAVPAGASSKTKSDWTRLVIPCRNGHKSAVIGYSPTHPWWLPDPNVDGGGVLNPHRWAGWYSNPCKGQWLVFYTWGGDPSEDSHTV